MTRRALLLASALGVTACGDGEPAAALRSGAPDAGAFDANADAAADGGAVIRTVLQRNPFGDVAETQNLLWDGDFEWASPFSDEYGWLPWPLTTTSTLPKLRVGPDCRSGLKCAVLRKNMGVIGIGVASKGSKLEVSFWARPAPTDTPSSCTSIQGALISTDSLLGAVTTIVNHDTDNPIGPTSATPGADGWCRFDAIVGERMHRTFLYVKNAGADGALVDDAVLKRAPTQTALRAIVGPPAPEWLHELEAVKAAVRSRAGPSDPPPNAARRAFEEWAKR